MFIKILLPKIQDYYSSSRDRFSRRSTAVGSTDSGKPPVPARDSFIALSENSNGDSTLNNNPRTPVQPWDWFLKSHSKPSSYRPDLENNNIAPSSRVYISSANDNATGNCSTSTIDKEDDKIYIKREFNKKETFLISVGESVDIDLDDERQLEREYISAFPRPGVEIVDGQRSCMNSVRLMRERHDRGLGNMKI